MSNVDLMNRTCEWMRNEICNKLEYLVPDDDANDEDYNVALAHPAVWPYFVPTPEMDVNAQAVPSACIQFIETEESFQGASQGTKTIQVRIVLTVWNPGEQIVFEPHENPAELGNVAYTPNTQGYTRNLDGWKDLVGFQDNVLRKIKADEYFAGMKVDMSSIKYGMYKDEQDSIYVLYPYWTGYIDFTATMGAARLVPEKYKDIL